MVFIQKIQVKTIPQNNKNDIMQIPNEFICKQAPIGLALNISTDSCFILNPSKPSNKKYNIFY